MNSVDKRVRKLTLELIRIENGFLALEALREVTLAELEIYKSWKNKPVKMSRIQYQKQKQKGRV